MDKQFVRLVKDSIYLVVHEMGLILIVAVAMGVYSLWEIIETVQGCFIFVIKAGRVYL